MNTTTRRTFLKASAGAAAASLLGLPAILSAAAPKARVVIVGGGYGGTIAAKYLRMMDPSIRVTLIEKSDVYVSCPLSNEVLAGERDLKSLTFNYRGLGRRGIAVVQDEIIEIDPAQGFVRGKSGGRYNYDKLGNRLPPYPGPDSCIQRVMRQNSTGMPRYVVSSQRWSAGAAALPACTSAITTSDSSTTPTLIGSRPRRRGRCWARRWPI